MKVFADKTSILYLAAFIPIGFSFIMQASDRSYLAPTNGYPRNLIPCVNPIICCNAG